MGNPGLSYGTGRLISFLTKNKTKLQVIRSAIMSEGRRKKIQIVLEIPAFLNLTGSKVRGRKTLGESIPI